MPLYVVERELPGITPQLLSSAGVRAKSCCAEISEAHRPRRHGTNGRGTRPSCRAEASPSCACFLIEGRSVHWIRSFFLPETSQTHCYFEAASPEVVAEANQRANIPFLRIAEVVEMTPEAL